MDAIELVVLGIMVALTPIFLGLSYMLWRDIDRGTEDVR